eukprot:13438704-Alexandrium_andersonii.AAC.1
MLPLGRQGCRAARWGRGATRLAAATTRRLRPAGRSRQRGLRPSPTGSPAAPGRGSGRCSR